ncbi:MAG: hypothetical protein ABI702_23485 [Burkholderiales bacterium]
MIKVDPKTGKKLVKVKVPDGTTTLSHGGVNYVSDGNGIVEVPESALEELSSHMVRLATVEEVGGPVVTNVEGEDLLKEIADAKARSTDSKLTKAQRDAALKKLDELELKLETHGA